MNCVACYWTLRTGIIGSYLGFEFSYIPPTSFHTSANCLCALFSHESQGYIFNGLFFWRKIKSTSHKKLDIYNLHKSLQNKQTQITPRLFFQGSISWTLRIWWWDQFGFTKKTEKTGRFWHIATIGLQPLERIVPGSFLAITKNIWKISAAEEKSGDKKIHNKTLPKTLKQ